ncbi:MAG: hypothetical protein MZV49_04755 [Rhodopseudomonas palustris]|nr:hypothetical protein [Rhodopseudomonas palustris]
MILEERNDEFMEMKLLLEQRISTARSIEKDLQFIDRRLAELDTGRKSRIESRKSDEAMIETLKVHISGCQSEGRGDGWGEYRAIEKTLSMKKTGLEAVRRNLQLLDNEQNQIRKEAERLREQEQGADPEDSGKSKSSGPYRRNAQRIGSDRRNSGVDGRKNRSPVGRDRIESREQNPCVRDGESSCN